MTSDEIGERAQNLFCLLITDLCGRPGPLFRPQFLGDKYPNFDYLVELTDHPHLFFFAQVKGTTLGYAGSSMRLRIRVPQDAIDRMVARPAPTYLVGIDVTATRAGFLLSVNEPMGRITSLTTRHSIDCSTLRRLHDEVEGYWSGRDMRLRGSSFREEA